MELQERITKLLNSSQVFLIATIDQRDFPTVISVSEPLWREGLLKFQFYIDGQGETAKNIQNNPNGSIYCYDETVHESLLLKGIFAIDQLEQQNVLENELSDYQKNLAPKYVALITFETWAAKIHIDKKTSEILI